MIELGSAMSLAMSKWITPSIARLGAMTGLKRASACSAFPGWQVTLNRTTIMVWASWSVFGFSSGRREIGSHGVRLDLVGGLHLPAGERIGVVGAEGAGADRAGQVTPELGVRLLDAPQRVAD